MKPRLTGKVQLRNCSNLICKPRESSQHYVEVQLSRARPGCSINWRVLLVVVVVIRALLFGVCIRASTCWRKFHRKSLRGWKPSGTARNLSCGMYPYHGNLNETPEQQSRFKVKTRIWNPDIRILAYPTSTLKKQVGPCFPSTNLPGDSYVVLLWL